MPKARKPAKRFCIFFASGYLGGGGGVITFNVFAAFARTSCYAAHVFSSPTELLPIQLSQKP